MTGNFWRRVILVGLLSSGPRIDSWQSVLWTHSRWCIPVWFARGWKERGEEQCCEYTVEWSPSPLMHPVVKGSYSNRFVEESTTVRDRLPYNLDLMERSRTWKSTYPVLLSPSLTHAPPIFSDHGEDAPFHFFGMNFMRGSSSAFLSVKYPPRIRPFLSISHTHTKRNSITESLNPIGFPLPRIFQG